MGKIIGIDLGTTNSCVSFMENGEAKVIANKEGVRTTPSIVAFTDKGEILVGAAAKRQAITNPENTIFSIKRIMGMMMNEPKAKEAQSKVPYKIVDKNGACAVEVNGKVYTPQEISAKILGKIKDDAEAFLGESVTDAVITVPAYFNDAQRKATKEAGVIAGLNVMRIVNEPTAAALAYGIDKKQAEKIVVVDCGGGTHDLTVLEVGEGVIEVLATDGDAFLGGDDFNNAIIDWLADEFKSQYGMDIKNDKMAMQRLSDAAENAKKELSSANETEVNLPFITADASGPKHLVTKLTRAKFEGLVDGLIKKAVSFIPSVLKAAGVEKSEIKEIVMVGGTTRIPKLQDEVKAFFGGKELNNSVNPDEVVADGAAIQGGILRGDVKDILLLDVTPLSLGIETLGGVMSKLIERNTTIPVKKSQTFSTAENNQTAVTINVGQGEREFIKDNKNLGRFNLDGIPPMGRGQAQIEVTFDIDANGILTVSAKEQSTGKEQNITITGASGLSDADIDQMIKDAELHKEEDEKRKVIVDKRNELDSMIAMAEKEELTGDKLEEAKNVIKDSESSKETLEKAIEELSQFIQAEMAKKQPTEEPQSDTSNDDVVDAEVV